MKMRWIESHGFAVPKRSSVARDFQLGFSFFCRSFCESYSDTSNATYGPAPRTFFWCTARCTALCSGRPIGSRTVISYQRVASAPRSMHSSPFPLEVSTLFHGALCVASTSSVQRIRGRVSWKPLRVWASSRGIVKPFHQALCVSLELMSQGPQGLLCYWIGSFSVVYNNSSTSAAVFTPAKSCFLWERTGSSELCWIFGLCEEHLDETAFSDVGVFLTNV